MTHVDEGALVRWIDGECEDVEHGELADHLGACAECDARLAAMRQRAELVRVALRRADSAPRLRARPAPSRMWAAAAAVLLVVTALAVQPVRAWVIERVASAWSAVTGARRVAPAAVPETSTQAVPRARGAVAFVPAGDVFVLHVTTHQASGRLTVSRTDRETASAEIIGSDGGESLLVLPAGLRIVNSAGSRTDYAVRLPPSIRQILVTIADDPAVRWTPDQDGWRRELRLTR